MRIVHYFVGSKNRHHGEAIIQGFGARAVPAESGRLVEADWHIIGGLQHGSAALFQEARKRGKRYLFVDRAYFGGGPGTDSLRVVRNAYQKHWIDDVAPGGPTSARAPQLRGWREDGRHVLVVPPSVAISGAFYLGDSWRNPEEWLRRVTGRPIRVSRKGDQEPLESRLADCWAVVTFTSNVAVEAICAGVPVFCSSYSAASPVGNDLADIAAKIENPWMPPEHHRKWWAESLARGQFTLDEIREGKAKGLL